MLTKETCQLLREPTFDNWQWEDEEMLVLLQQMYLQLELPKKFDIEINILRNFLVRVYHSYNDVPFHNFRHCFCVTQMVSYSISRIISSCLFSSSFCTKIIIEEFILEVKNLSSRSFRLSTHVHQQELFPLYMHIIIIVWSCTCLSHINI